MIDSPAATTTDLRPSVSDHAGEDVSFDHERDAGGAVVVLHCRDKARLAELAETISRSLRSELSVLSTSSIVEAGRLLREQNTQLGVVDVYRPWLFGRWGRIIRVLRRLSAEDRPLPLVFYSTTLDPAAITAVLARTPQGDAVDADRIPVSDEEIAKWAVARIEGGPDPVRVFAGPGWHMGWTGEPSAAATSRPERDAGTVQHIGGEDVAFTYAAITDWDRSTETVAWFFWRRDTGELIERMDPWQKLPPAVIEGVERVLAQDGRRRADLTGDPILAKVSYRLGAAGGLADNLVWHSVPSRVKTEGNVMAPTHHLEDIDHAFSAEVNESQRLRLKAEGYEPDDFEDFLRELSDD